MCGAACGFTFSLFFGKCVCLSDKLTLLFNKLIEGLR